MTPNFSFFSRAASGGKSSTRCPPRTGISSPGLSGSESGRWFLHDEPGPGGRIACSKLSSAVVRRVIVDQVLHRAARRHRCSSTGLHGEQDRVQPFRGAVGQTPVQHHLERRRDPVSERGVCAVRLRDGPRGAGRELAVGRPHLVDVAADLRPRSRRTSVHGSEPSTPGCTKGESAPMSRKFSTIRRAPRCAASPRPQGATYRRPASCASGQVVDLLCRAAQRRPDQPETARSPARFPAPRDHHRESAVIRARRPANATRRRVAEQTAS